MSEVCVMVACVQVYEQSHQYKAIAEKFGLSKEHPGFDVNPTLNDLLNSQFILGLCNYSYCCEW